MVLLELDEALKHGFSKRSAYLVSFNRAQAMQCPQFRSADRKTQLTHNGLNAVNVWATLGGDIFQCKVDSVTCTADELASHLTNEGFDHRTAVSDHGHKVLRRFLIEARDILDDSMCSFADRLSSFWRGVKATQLLTYPTRLVFGTWKRITHCVPKLHQSSNMTTIFLNQGAHSRSCRCWTARGQRQWVAYSHWWLLRVFPKCKLLGKQRILWQWDSCFLFLCLLVVGWMVNFNGID